MNLKKFKIEDGNLNCNMLLQRDSPNISGFSISTNSGQFSLRLNSLIFINRKLSRSQVHETTEN